MSMCAIEHFTHTTPTLHKEAMENKAANERRESTKGATSGTLEGSHGCKGPL